LFLLQGKPTPGLTDPYGPSASYPKVFFAAPHGATHHHPELCLLDPGPGFLGKSMAELQLRSRFHIDVIAIRDIVSDKLQMVPPADFVIKDGEVLVVVGKEKDIQQIK
jgi:hypothetical protein